jgi:hypothetical protein
VSERPDPRSRPPDPAGTQPKVDPESLRALLPEGDRPALPAEVEGQPSPPPARQPLATTGSGAAHATAVASAGLQSQPAPAAAGLPAPTPSAPSQPHAPRFQLLFGALGALGVAAAALVVVLLRAPAPVPAQPWSAWQPTNDGVDPAQQIASYVAPRYRLDDGRQIVRASGGPPALKGQPLTVGIVKSGRTPSVLEGNSVLYELCGDGTDCSIKEGRPSEERALLLAREALELALYTFHYVSGVNQVIVTIPSPPPTSATTANTATTSTQSAGSTSSLPTVHHALLFRQQDVAPELGHPLGLTLAATTPRVSQMGRSPDAALVRALTEPRLYDFVISENQQNGPVMLLAPPNLSG